MWLSYGITRDIWFQDLLPREKKYDAPCLRLGGTPEINMAKSAIGIRVSSTRLDFQVDPSVLLSVLRILYISYISVFFYEALQETTWNYWTQSMHVGSSVNVPQPLLVSFEAG